MVYVTDKKLCYGIVYTGNFQSGGQLSGKGKMIFPKGHRIVSCEGDFKIDRVMLYNVKSNGTIIYSNGSRYVGDFCRVDGGTTFERHGYGTMTYSDGGVFKGRYTANYRSHFGKMTYPDGTIEERRFADEYGNWKEWKGRGGPPRLGEGRGRGGGEWECCCCVFFY